MQKAKKVIRNTGILYVKMGVTMFISLYTTRLILDSLGVIDFGIFNIVGGAIAMLGFLNSTMASATQRFMSFAIGSGNVEKEKNVFNVSILLHFLIALILGVALVIMGYFFFNGILNISPNRINAAKLVYYFMIVSTMLTIMTVPYDAVLNANENMLYFAIIGIVESFLKLAVAFIVFYTLADKLIIYGVLMAAISLVIMISMRIYCHRSYVECVFEPRKYFDKDLMKEMTNFASWNFLGSASSIIAGYGSGIILNHFHGTILNAANGIAGQLNGQLLVFSNTMQKALNPVITKSEGEGNRELLIKATLSGSKISFLLFAFFSIPFLIETHYILKLWLKNVPIWTLLFVQFAIVFTLIEQITGTLGTAISAVGNIKKINIYTSLVITLNLLALYIVFQLGLPPNYMPMLAILVACCITLIKIYYAKKYCGITYGIFFKEVIVPILIVFCLSLTLGFIPNLLMDSSFLRLILVCLLSSATFVVVSFMFAFTINEKLILRNLTKAIIKRMK
jgi:O-antigen/teichoic acid export membrane protein